MKDVYVMVILFFVYSFMGAMLEHMSYYIGSLIDPSSPKKALANPIITGFPIYGIGAFMVVGIKRCIVDKLHLPIAVEFLLYLITFMAFEYAIGEYVNAGSTSYVRDENGQELVMSWDYSKNAGNISGKIDIMHSVVFALIGLLIARLHPYLESKIRCIVE